MPSPFAAADFARRLAQAAPGLLLLEPLTLRRLLKKHAQRFGPTGVGLDAAGACLRRPELQDDIADVASVPPVPTHLPEWVVLLAWPPPRRPWLKADPGIEAKRLLTEAYRQLLRRGLLEAKPSFEEQERWKALLGPATWAEAIANLRRDGQLAPPFAEATALRELLAEAATQARLGAGIGDFLPHCAPELLPAVEAAVHADAVWATLAPFQDELVRTLRTEAREEVAAGVQAKPAGDDSQVRQARAVGNTVRALLLASEPADLEELVRRLAAALGLAPTVLPRWRSWLEALLPAARADHGAQAARLLYDVQKACIDREKAIYTVDVIGFLRFPLRLGVKRPLPLVPGVLVLKHLRSALARVPLGGLAPNTQHEATSLLEQSIHHEEEALRRQLRPLLKDLLPGMGLHPTNLPERLAHEKLRDDLTELAVEKGRFAFSDLRDALSRNDLKLPDLSGPWQFFRGDALIRADRELAVRLDGVYHAGEVYLRWFQSLSSVAFGTALGRFVTKYVALPFGGAFMALEFMQHMVAPLLAKVLGHKPHFVSLYSIVALGLYLLLLLHVPAVRAASARVAQALGRGLRWLFVSLPWLLYTQSPLRGLLRSAPVKWLLRTFLAPAAVAGLARIGCYAYDLDPEFSRWFSLGVFVALAIFGLTKAGRWVEERISDAFVQSWDLLRVEFIPGLIRFVADLFRWLMEQTERGLYAVDEWLRFRQGDPPFAVFFKGVLGLLWFVIVYIFRFALRLLVEPQVNPLKHFPVVTVSHKLLLPTIPSVARLFRQLLPNHTLYADALAGGLVTGIPGVFGFLVWELKENWRLYAANRPARLEPAVVGHHGETVRRLLRPGFHSGTIPTQYARLRAVAAGRARPSLKKKAEAELDHVEHGVGHLVEREFLAYLAASKRWKRPAPRLLFVALTANQIRVELAPPHGEAPWELRTTWLDDALQAELRLPPTLRLAPAEEATLALALAGLWARMGIERPTFAYPLWSGWIEAWQEKAGKHATPLAEELRKELLSVRA